MPQSKYVAPDPTLTAFSCPFCTAFAAQTLESPQWKRVELPPSQAVEAFAFVATHCAHCGQKAYWQDRALIYPRASTAPLPSGDMPADVHNDYEEARRVHPSSPRAAAALLRLALQQLLRHLGQTGEDLDADIAELVKHGLPVSVQQALDAVRVIGKNAVHPGQIDVADQPQTALALFDLLNFIIEKLITEPKRIQAIQDQLPESAKGAIARRDERGSGK